MKAGGGFEVIRLKPNTKFLVETAGGALYTFKLVKPELKLVEAYSTDPTFQPYPPKLCYLVAACTDVDGGGTVILDWVVKGGRMLLRFKDANFVSEPVISATLEGDGWKYDVIQ